jgi:hypothetical protein
MKMTVDDGACEYLERSLYIFFLRGKERTRSLYIKTCPTDSAAQKAKKANAHPSPPSSVQVPKEKQ